MSENDAAEYPGVQFAYDYVLPSYDWMLQRVQAAENRIQAVQVFATSFTFGVPAFAKVLNPALSFSAGRFVLAMLAFVVLMILGAITITRSGLKLANPNVFYERWL